MTRPLALRRSHAAAAANRRAADSRPAARQWREQELVHRPFVRFLALALPRSRVREHGCWWHHSPLEALRPENAGIMVGLGTLPGFFDLLLVKRGGAHVIECKAPGGDLSADQMAFRELCQMTGVPCDVIESPEEGEAVLRRWGFPICATMQDVRL